MVGVLCDDETVYTMSNALYNELKTLPHPLDVAAQVKGMHIVSNTSIPINVPVRYGAFYGPDVNTDICLVIHFVIFEANKYIYLKHLCQTVLYL